MSSSKDRRKFHPVDYNDHQWQRLMDFALARADRFECVVPYPFVVLNMESAPIYPKALRKAGGRPISRYVSHVRWDRMMDSPVQFLCFDLSDELVSYISKVGQLSQWDWRQGYPEDPTFLCGDDILLKTESGEGRIAVFLDDIDLGALANSGVRLVESLGVEAEPWPTP